MVSHALDENEWKTVGYWFNEKKSQKFGSSEMAEACRKRRINFVKLNLEEDLNSQGSFDLILHKFTPLYSLSVFGDKQAKQAVEALEEYLKNCPSVIVVDPLSVIKQLLLREETYKLMGFITKDEKKIFTPTFVTLRENDVTRNRKLLEDSGVTFPVVCKPLDAGGGPHAHQMALIMHEDKMADFPTPCIAESFIKHGAILYKLFILGDKWFVSLRPSLKNFSKGDFDSIFFNSHHVSKVDSVSPLTHLDEEDVGESPKADLKVLQRIVTMVKDSLLCDFLGIDVVIDVEKDRYAIIDVNPFPSYDMVPNLMDTIAEALYKKLHSTNQSVPVPTVFQPTSDVDQSYFL